MSESTPATPESHAAEHIHMPAPSWAPIVIALGMTAMGFGIILSPIVLLIGVVVFILGFVVAIAEDIRHGHPEAS